ncbi:MAG TPA: sugar phosphate isomerase/epimerase family protein [Acetobacteraceae bacterium]|nr:sugar phosphate isomerase/epimerase family protein [Acetobacteraceae bacterium]
MKIGIDSYCYHRFFGDWYPDIQTDPGRCMDVWDFLDRAHVLGVAGVSLECCYLPAPTDDFLARLRARLAELGIEPVWAWGHPNGLGSGTLPEAAADLVRHLDAARRVGAGVMRICGGGRRTRPASWSEHKARLVPMLRRLCDDAERAGVVMAIENHIDMLGHEMAELIEAVGSPWLGVCLDTGNNLRMGEDASAVVRLLAPLARATHVKSLVRRDGDPAAFATWPSVPLGEGAVDIAEVLRVLRTAGYRGLLAVEVDYLDPAWPGDEDAAVAASISYLRTLLPA